MMPRDACRVRVLVNSLPKSGTHLLAKAVALLGVDPYEQSRSLLSFVRQRIPFGVPPFLTRRSASRKAGSRGRAPHGCATAVPIGVSSPVSIKASVVRAWLARVPPGHFLIGHVPFSQAMEEVLLELGWRTACIVRDPRAVLSSYLHYVLRKEGTKHFLRDDFLHMDRRQQIDFTLDGGLAPRAQVQVCGLAEAFMSVLGWTASDSAIMLRFEDLVGERGGGSAVRQRETMRGLAGHLGLGLDSQDNDRLGGIFDPGAPTFRIGSIDSWQADFSEQEIRRVQDKLAPVMKTLGYSSYPGIQT